MTTATEPVREATPTEAPPPAENETPRADAEPARFNPDTLSAEVKAYVEAERAEATKKYSDYEQKSADAREWDGVRNDPRFQAWVKSINTPAQPKPFEVTDEQFAAALSDKGQFTALVRQAAEALIKEQVSPQLERVNQHNEFQSKVNELSQTVAKFPDFKEMDKRGLIEPIIRKYPAISFEDAYWLAKKDTLNEEADRRARGIIAGKKAAVVERPGLPSGARGPRVSAKNREEAMTMAMEAARAGRPIPDFEEIGDG